MFLTLQNDGLDPAYDATLEADTRDDRDVTACP